MIRILGQLAAVTPVPPTISVAPSDEVGWFDLRLINWSGWGIENRIGLFWILVVIATIVALRWVIPIVRKKWFGSFRIKSVKLTFKGVEWDVCPDHETRRVAHQAWVEIKSRKVGLQFDEDHDVVVEVYNSWYAIFGVLRELAKSIPADRLRECEETRKVVAVLMQSLNEGLRPHLTRWQAKFRRWYEAESKKPENVELTPQAIQKKYPEFGALAEDLKKVNRDFVAFADSLAQVVKEGK